jgi:hypothetical protein
MMPLCWPLALFEKPAPVWHDSVWPLLLLPLCLGISIVYKSIKCSSMRRVAREALVLCAIIIVVMLLVAGALAVLVKLLEMR